MINKAKSAKKYTTNDFKLFITLIFFVLLFVDALNGYLVVNKIINSGNNIIIFFREIIIIDIADLFSKESKII